MQISPSKLNKFLLVKLPIAWISGVRIKSLGDRRCEVGVTHRWINQNPFNSLYFAVQAMAAELSTGALVMGHIRESKRKISMLVAQNRSEFNKKATGKIRFVCEDGETVSRAVEEAVRSGEGTTFWMRSVGINEDDAIVSSFEFEWTIKLKN